MCLFFIFFKSYYKIIEVLGLFESSDRSHKTFLIFNFLTTIGYHLLIHEAICDINNFNYRSMFVKTKIMLRQYIYGSA